MDGAVPASGSTLVAPHQALRVVGLRSPFVSRGGWKLAHALDHWEIAVAGRRAVDVGASTGGFTDCLRQRGAALVVAVDSGHGQLHPKLRDDPGVRSLEHTNARYLLAEHPELLGFADLVVADVSFISLRVLAPVLAGLAASGGTVVVLVKPQFEVGRAVAARGRGVVRDLGDRLEAVEAVAGSLVANGVAVVDAEPSPILGPAGNAEVFLLGCRSSEATDLVVPRERLEGAVAATADLAPAQGPQPQ